MPTGYTAQITDGDGVTFAEFALSCARAFGALITMRDDAPGAPIPDAFPPSDYHEKARDRAVAQLIDLAQMTEDEVRVAAEKDYVEALRRHREVVARDAATKLRYEAMLDQVLAWEPPTDEHVGLKAFMVEQIESSLQFDCGYQWPTPTRRTTAEWLKDQREKAERDVEYHEKEHVKEVERATGRTEWIQKLRASL